VPDAGTRLLLTFFEVDMSRWKLTLAAMLTLAAPGGLYGPTASFALDVPSPANSDVPDCLVACPEGEILYRITVRGFANNPIPGASVTLDFGACPVFPYCGPNGGPYQVDVANKMISRSGGGDGVADFNLALRGTCGDIVVKVYADGVLLDNVRLPVMDQDGNGVVGPDDVLIATAKIGGSDRSADVDCSGSITAADVDIIAAHNGHECPLPTPVRPSTWGRLKTYYR